MRRLHHASLPTLILTALAASPIHAVTYQASLLDPAFQYYDSEALGISGNVLVGDARLGLGDPAHALLWQYPLGSPVDLHPAAYYDSSAYRISGGQQVGVGHTFVGKQHALLWNGSAASVVDLHPAGANESVAQDISDGRQAGMASYGVNNETFHAMMWSGTASSAVDLHPAGFKFSYVEAISGHTQVGDGYPTTINERHAIMWHDTAQSYIDLNPPGFYASSATSISGDTQIGSGFVIGLGYRAVLWKGTAQSAVDLTPPGYSEALALGGSGSGQVGYGVPSEINPIHYHALYWNGTADSVIDLTQSLDALPVQFTHTFALNIDNNGSIVGWGQDAQARHYAILWTPVPEPTSLALLTVGIALVSIRVRKARRS